MEANRKGSDWEKQAVQVTAGSSFWSFASRLEAFNTKSTQALFNDCVHPPLPSFSFHTARHPDQPDLVNILHSLAILLQKVVST